MKGYKGFKRGLMCRGKQYAEDTVFEEESAVICETGMHFCKLPHQVFRYYEPGCGNEFAEVETLDEVHTDDNEKFVTTKLKIGKKISVAELCKRSVPEFFAAFEFDRKIEEAKQTKESCSGNFGAANAGNYGAANAGDCGAANAGKFGAANAGNCGVANVGDYGVANAGNRGAANSGNYGTAIVLGDGVASAGSCGVSIVRENGISSVKPGGAAVAFDGWAKGEIGAALVLIETDKAQGIKEIKAVLVDGEKIKTDTYYRLENGEVIEMEESK